MFLIPFHLQPYQRFDSKDQWADIQASTTPPPFLSRPGLYFAEVHSGALCVRASNESLTKITDRCPRAAIKPRRYCCGTRQITSRPSLGARLLTAYKLLGT